MTVHIVDAEGCVLGVFEDRQDADKHAERCRAKWTDPHVSSISVTRKVNRNTHLDDETLDAINLELRSLH